MAEAKAIVDKKRDLFGLNLVPVHETLRNSFEKWNAEIQTPLRLRMHYLHGKLGGFKSGATAFVDDYYSRLVSSMFDFYIDKVLAMEDQLNDSPFNRLILSKRRVLHSKFRQLEGASLFTRPQVDDAFQSIQSSSSDFIQGLCRLTSRKNAPNVFLSSNELEIGDTLISSVLVPTPRNPFDKLQVALRTLFGKYPLVALKFGEEYFPLFCTHRDQKYEIYRSLIPSTPLDLPRSENLAIEIRDGNHSVYEQKITIKNKDYPVESIWLSEGKSSLKPTPKETEEMSNFFQLKTPRQYWDLPFLKPCDGDVTTDYGLKRYYNGVFAEKYYHKGIDYGAWTGEPVVSPASGRIALIGHESDGYEFHGNCVGIDHGNGVQSILMHLDSIAVSHGDYVRAGEVIGCVGETGIATGPHLHWGLYVCGKCVNPKDWMK